MTTSASILGISSYFPVNILDNDQLASIYPDWSSEKIFQKTGIKRRHICAADQTASDLAYMAAQSLFDNNPLCRAANVDFLLLVTQAPDYVLPTTACVLQDRLGIPTKSGALDINLGCSGYVYALSLANGLIASGSANSILLLTADSYSKYINPLDRSVRTLFGDAGTATYIAKADNALSNNFFGEFIFGTDGSGSGNLIVKSGSFRHPADDDSSREYIDDLGNTRSSEDLYMNGAEVMKFSLTEVPKAVKSLLVKSGLDMEDVDYFVFHQANKFMLESLRKKIKIPVHKFPLCYEEHGNTVSSTIPITLQQMMQRGQIKSGLKIMLLGFGVGYSWAGCIVNT